MPNPDDSQEWNAFACKVKDVQGFVPATIVRSDDLGTEMCFRDALEPVTRITDLFLQIPINRLKELPPSSIQRMDALCDEVKGQYDQILKFSAVSENAHAVRLALINHINDLADRVHSSLALDVIYLCVKEIGFSEKLKTFETILINQTRNTDGRLKASIDGHGKKIAEIEQEARQVLDDVRRRLRSKEFRNRQNTFKRRRKHTSKVRKNGCAIQSEQQYC